MDQAIEVVFIATLVTAVVLVGALGVTMGLAARQRLRHQQALSRRLLEAQEQERARVAREVHDDAVQRLAALRRELADRMGVAANNQGVVAEVDDLIVSLRRLAHGLHPAVLTQSGLAESIQHAADGALENWGLSVSCILPTEPVTVSRSRQLAMFRITQEALRNVSVHADTREATVTLAATDDTVRLDIADKGAGFASLKEGAGLGLIAMGERARLEGGVLEVRSEPGQGTVVTARFPRTEAS